MIEMDDERLKWPTIEEMEAAVEWAANEVGTVDAGILATIMFCLADVQAHIL